MVFFFLIAALAAADLLIKAEIESREGKDFPKPLDKRGWITLHKSHNPGLPFGLLKKNEEAVRMIPVAMASALGGILVWLLQRRGHLYEKTGIFHYDRRSAEQPVRQIPAPLRGGLFFDQLRQTEKGDIQPWRYDDLCRLLLILIHELWESIRDGR